MPQGSAPLSGNSGLHICTESRVKLQSPHEVSDELCSLIVAAGTLCVVSTRRRYEVHYSAELGTGAREAAHRAYLPKRFRHRHGIGKEAACDARQGSSGSWSP